MKKILLFLCLLILAVPLIHAQEIKTVEITPSSFTKWGNSSTAYVTAEQTILDNFIVNNYAGSSKVTAFTTRGNKATETQNFYLYNKSELGGTIESIEIVCENLPGSTSGDCINLEKIKVSLGSSPFSSTSSNNCTETLDSQTKTIKYTPASGYENYKYFRIQFVNKSTTGTAKVEKIVITYKEAVVDPNYVEAPTFTPEGGNIVIGNTVAIACETEGAALSYSLDNGSSWTDYTAPIALNDLGAVTITAKASKGTGSAEKTATFTVIEAPKTKTFAIKAKNVTYSGTSYSIEAEGSSSNSNINGFKVDGIIELTLLDEPTYQAYSNGTQLILYAKNKIKFTPAEGITFKSIKLEDSNGKTNAKVTADFGDVSPSLATTNATWVWTNDKTNPQSKPVELTFEAQIKCPYIEIEYEQEAVTPKEVVSDPAADASGVVTVDKNGEVSFSSKNASALWVKIGDGAESRITTLPYVFKAEANNQQLTITPGLGTEKYTDKAKTFTVKWCVPSDMTVSPAPENDAIEIGLGGSLTFTAQYAGGFNVYYGEDATVPTKVEGNPATWTPTDLCADQLVKVAPLDYEGNEMSTVAKSFYLTVTDPTQVVAPEFGQPSNVTTDGMGNVTIGEPYYIGQPISLTCDDSRATIEYIYRTSKNESVDYQTYLPEGLTLITPGLTTITARSKVSIKQEGEAEATVYYSPLVTVNYYVSAKPIERTISIVADNAATQGSAPEEYRYTVDGPIGDYSNMKGFEAGDMIKLDVTGEASNRRPYADRTIENGWGKFRLYAGSTVTFEPLTGVVIKKITLKDTYGGSTAKVTANCGTVTPNEAKAKSEWTWEGSSHDPVTLTFSAAMRCDYFDIVLDDKADEPLAVIASPEAVEDEDFGPIIYVAKEGTVTFTCEAAESLLLYTADDEEGLATAEPVELTEQPWTYTANDDTRYIKVVPKAYDLEYHDKAYTSSVWWGTPSEVRYEVDNGVIANNIVTISQGADIKFISQYASGFMISVEELKIVETITANKNGEATWTSTVPATSDDSGVLVEVYPLNYQEDQVTIDDTALSTIFSLVVHAPEVPADVTFTPIPEAGNELRVPAGTEITLNGCLHTDYILYYIPDKEDNTVYDNESFEALGDQRQRYDKTKKPTVDRGMTIYARGYNENHCSANVTSMTYKLELPGAPTFDPASGAKLMAGTEIKIECKGAAQIRYMIYGGEVVYVDLTAEQPYATIVMPEKDITILATGANADGEEGGDGKTTLAKYTYLSSTPYLIASDLAHLTEADEYILYVPGNNPAITGALGSNNIGRADLTDLPQTAQDILYIDPKTAISKLTLNEEIVGEQVKYTIKVGDQYIGQGSTKPNTSIVFSSTLPESHSSYLFTITFETDGTVDIKSSADRHLYYSIEKDANLFRLYASAVDNKYLKPYLYRRDVQSPEQLHMHGAVNGGEHWDFANPVSGNKDQNGHHTFAKVYMCNVDGGFGHIVFSDWKADEASAANAPRKVYARAEATTVPWSEIHANGGTIYAPATTQIVAPQGNAVSTVPLKEYPAPENKEDITATPMLMVPANNFYDFAVKFNGGSPILEVNKTEGMQTGVEAVGVEDEDVEWYNLQGIRIENPAPGAVYIRRQGNTSIKIAL